MASEILHYYGETAFTGSLIESLSSSSLQLLAGSQAGPGPVWQGGRTGDTLARELVHPAHGCQREGTGDSLARELVPSVHGGQREGTGGTLASESVHPVHYGQREGAGGISVPESVHPVHYGQGAGIGGVLVVDARLVRCVLSSQTAHVWRLPAKNTPPLSLVYLV